MKRADITGKTFNRLTVLSYSHTLKSKAYWNCLCECGNKTVVASHQLKSGKTRSCGCYHIDRIRETCVKHPYRHHPLYEVWLTMKQRCFNPTSQRYNRYGQRGITVCNEWMDPETFIKWCLNNGWQKGLEIDRINNDGNYEPSNCRFVTHLVNGNNTSKCKYITFNNKTLTISGWERELNTKPGNVKGRLLKGWSVEDALTKPFVKVAHPSPL